MDIDWREITTTIGMGTAQRAIRYELPNGTHGRVGYWAHEMHPDDVRGMDNLLQLHVAMICEKAV